VLLSVDKPGLSGVYPAAIAVVVEGWADVAKVHVLYQREVKIDGAQVRMIGRDERARLNQYVGKVATIQTGRARIDLGSFDGVHEGDEYEIRAGVESERSIGRLRIVQVEELQAWAQIVDGQAEVREGQTAVWLQSAAEAQQRPAGETKIVVVNFDPVDVQDATESKASRVFAKDFANELQAAADAMGGVKASYEPNERLAVMPSDAEGHAAARTLGKRLGVDLVVWGAMRCDKRACAQ